ncbi:hypothetical protein BGZ58_004779, partial [Dissophora ornata]
MERMKVNAQRELDNATRHRDRSNREAENHRQEQTQQIQEDFLARALRRQQVAEARQAEEIRLRQAAEALEERRRQAAEVRQTEVLRLQQVTEERNRQAAEAAEGRQVRVNRRQQAAEDRRRQAIEARRRNRQTHQYLPEYQAALREEGEAARLVLAKIGPVWLTPAAAAQVEEIRRTTVDNTEPRVISSDGSMINAGQEVVAMAFGIVDRSNTVIRTVQGRTDGFASSAKAELMGLFAATISAPPNQDIVVQLDNQSVVQQYQQLVKHRLYTLPRKRQRSNFAGIWAALHQVVQERPGKMEVQWVRGHAENKGNNMADMVATLAARADTVPWAVDLSMQQDITQVAFCQNTM